MVVIQARPSVQLEHREVRASCFVYFYCDQMILMGFNYGINSLKFIKSVQLTASFQQVRFSSIKFQVQKKI